MFIYLFMCLFVSVLIIFQCPSLLKPSLPEASSTGLQIASSPTGDQLCQWILLQGLDYEVSKVSKEDSSQASQG